MNTKQIFLLIVTFISTLVSAQNIEKLIYKLENKTPFYFTERHIEYNNIDYAESETQIIIYNIDNQNYKAIRIKDLEPMIIKKRELKHKYYIN